MRIDVFPLQAQVIVVHCCDVQHECPLLRKVHAAVGVWDAQSHCVELEGVPKLSESDGARKRAQERAQESKQMSHVQHCDPVAVAQG